MFEVGKKFKLKAFSKKCPYAYMQKLIAMGFIPGAEFKVIQKAPLGNPYKIQINNYHVSIRSTELKFMEVSEK